MKNRSLVALSILSLVLACEGNQQPLGPTAPGDPSKVISDGTRAGGNPDFFFLPPLVPNPSSNSNFERGKFNNALQPSLTVEICELVPVSGGGLPTATTGCANEAVTPHTAPVKTFGPGTVRQVGLPRNQSGWWTTQNLPDEGFYYVLWDTKQSNLDVSKYYRIKVLVAGSNVPLGFADVDPMLNMREWHNVRTGDVIPLVDDAMLPIPFRVERGALCTGGACNSATITNISPTGSQSITVDGGGGSITGATFPDHWLPSGDQCAPTNPCPQSVVVTINEVNTPGSGLPGESTVCHPALNPKLQQFRGCFHFSTTPALQPFNEDGDQFAQPVTVAVCYELEGTTDPRRDFAELYASDITKEPQELPHPLEDVPEGVLVVAKDCSRPPVIGLGSTNPLVQLASSGWQRLKVGLNRAFGIKTAYAVDLGLGGIVKGFSNISPVLSATIEATSSQELTLSPGATTTASVRILGSHHHADHAQTGIAGLPVTFTSTAGALSAATVTTNSDGTASVNWTMPTGAGTGPYTLTADGPALGGPVTFTATVVQASQMLSMQTGATFQISVAPDVVASWASSNPTDVTVSNTGLVTAINGGEDVNGTHAANLTSLHANGSAGPTVRVNTVFDIFPRVTTLAWAPVNGAVSYQIEHQFGNGCTGFANCSLWSASASPPPTNLLSYTFGFVGAQPGRWHVIARDANGNIIPGQFDVQGVPIPDSPSPWIYFRYNI